jgi:Mg-chelatase subunit ChlD
MSVPRSFLTAVLMVLVEAAVPGRAGDPEGTCLKANLDLPYEAFGDEDVDPESPEFIVFYGQQFEGDGIFFCCDQSASMQGQKFARLQREVLKSLNQFSERVQFAIVFFNNEMTRFPANCRPADAIPAMKAAATAMVQACKPSGGTCTKAALFASLSYADQSTAKRKVIIFLSDGYCTCPGTIEQMYEKQILDDVSGRNSQQVHINTIGIGLKVNEDWLRALAAQNSGTYVRIGG